MRLSSPRANLPIFFLCAKMTSTDKTILKSVIHGDSFFNTKCTTSGNTTAATIAPKETYLEMMNTMKKTPKQMSAAIG